MAGSVLNALTYGEGNLTIGDGAARRVQIAIQGEGSGGQPTCTVGGTACTVATDGTNSAHLLINPGSTSQAVTILELKEAAIAALGGAGSYAVSVGNAPTNRTVHRIVWQDVDQGDAEEVDSDSSTSGTPNPLINADVAVTAGGVVFAIGGQGNAGGSDAWAAPLTGGTSQVAGATTRGHAAFGVFASPTNPVNVRWTAQSPNRQVVIAVAIGAAATGPAITGVADDQSATEAGEAIDGVSTLTVTGTDFGSTEGELWATDNAGGLGIGNDVQLTPSAWADTEITAPLDGLVSGSISLPLFGGAFYLVVVHDDTSESSPFAMTGHAEVYAPAGVTNANVTCDTDTPYVALYRAENDGAEGQDEFEFFFDHEAGGDTVVSTSAAAIQAIDSDGAADADDISEVLTGSGTYQEGYFSETGQIVLQANFGAAAVNWALAFQIPSAQVDDADTIDLGVRRGDGSALDGSDNDLTITVNEIAGGGVSISVPLDVFSITDNVPGVAAGKNIAVPLDTLALSDLLPRVGTSALVVSPADALTETDQVPLAGTGGGGPVSAADALTATDQAPTIQTGVNVGVPADALAVADQVPDAGTGTIAAAPADALTVADQVPAVTAAVGVEVAAPADALAVADQAPAVATGGGGPVSTADVLTIIDHAPVVTATAETADVFARPTPTRRGRSARWARTRAEREAVAAELRGLYLGVYVEAELTGDEGLASAARTVVKDLPGAAAALVPGAPAPGTVDWVRLAAAAAPALEAAQTNLRLLAARATAARRGELEEEELALLLLLGGP